MLFSVIVVTARQAHKAVAQIHLELGLFHRQVFIQCKAGTDKSQTDYRQYLFHFTP